MYNVGGSPTIVNCILSQNMADDGGGMYNEWSTPKIINCTFTQNTALGRGGGMSNSFNSPIMENCIFSNNISKYDGGGIYNVHCNPTIENCAFSGNTAGKNGGGISSYRSSTPIIQNCTFIKNTATENGGGIHNIRNSNSIIQGCVISQNISNCGGGMYNEWSFPKLNNCTFTQNTATENGGGMYNYDYSRPVLKNCILWNNTAIFDGNEIFGNALSTIQFCNIAECGSSGSDWNFDIGIDGGGNIDADPLFNNLRLTKGSPCIDKGDPDSEFLPDATDLDGNPRVINGIVDMGAYEYIPSVEVPVDIKPQSCPNPVNVKSKGVLPVAILGSDVLDVNDIDFETIKLEGIAPIRYSYEDVATPVYNEGGCSCSTDGPDGYIDLTLKFDTQEILNILGDVVDGEEWLLNLTGNLYDSTPIEGSDCIVILKKGKK